LSRSLEDWLFWRQRINDRTSDCNDGGSPVAPIGYCDNVDKSETDSLDVDDDTHDKEEEPLQVLKLSRVKNEEQEDVSVVAVV